MATTLKGEERGRGGRLERTQDGYVFTESRTYVVISTIVNESPATVALTSGLPIPGLSVTTAGALCRSTDPKQDPKQPKVWKVAAEFSTEPLNQKTDASGTPDPNPTNWIPIYEGAIETIQEVMMKDRSPTPKNYVNSAGDKFPEPLIRNRPIIVYEFTQYELPSVTDVQIGDRNDTTNSATFKGFPAKTLKLNTNGFTRGWYFGYEAVKIKYRVAYKKDNWLNKPLDMGYSYRPSAGADRVNSPVLVCLNTNGTKKADTATPDALEFIELPEIDFGTFLRT